MKTQAKSTKQVLKAIGSDKLSLYAGKDYWYFVYDDIAKTGRYDTLMVYTPRLGDMPLERWVQEGKDLVAKMEKSDV